MHPYTIRQEEFPNDGNFTLKNEPYSLWTKTLKINSKIKNRVSIMRYRNKRRHKNECLYKEDRQPQQV